MSTQGRTVSLRTALAMVAATTAVFFAGVYVANAVAPGARGGHTRTALTVAGTLVGVPAAARPHITFTFSKAGAPPCVVAVAPEGVRYVAATGAFNAEVDLERCAPTLFDGADVTVMAEVRDGSAAGAVLVSAPATAVNPVPYARYADHYGTPDCPVGYERATDPAFTGDMRLCRKSRMDGTMRVVYDEVVRVGTGASAFWIDRYEASVWESDDGLGRQRLVSEGDLDQSVFPRNGQWVRPYFALSRTGVEVARHVNWFMASAACRASGKRLPSDEEWLAAARRTVDPGANNGVTPPNGRCHTLGPVGVAFRRAGLGYDCQSAWGAQDMIGNVREWIGLWVGGPATTPDTTGLTLDSVWEDRDSVYFGDGVDTLTSWVYPGGDSRVRGPAAPLRGGHVVNTTDRASRMGVFYYTLYAGPSNWDVTNGFRCVIPR